MLKSVKIHFELAAEKIYVCLLFALILFVEIVFKTPVHEGFQYLFVFVFYVTLPGVCILNLLGEETDPMQNISFGVGTGFAILTGIFLLLKILGGGVFFFIRLSDAVLDFMAIHQEEKCLPRIDE